MVRKLVIGLTAMIAVGAGLVSGQERSDSAARAREPGTAGCRPLPSFARGEASGLATGRGVWAVAGGTLVSATAGRSLPARVPGARRSGTWRPHEGSAPPTSSIVPAQTRSWWSHASARAASPCTPKRRTRRGLPTAISPGRRAGAWPSCLTTAGASSGSTGRSPAARSSLRCSSRRPGWLWRSLLGRLTAPPKAAGTTISGSPVSTAVGGDGSHRSGRAATAG